MVKLFQEKNKNKAQPSYIFMMLNITIETKIIWQTKIMKSILTAFL